MSPDLLEEVLVELRPAPDADWAAELDERVERGFERPAPARPARARRWRASLYPALGAAACVVIVVFAAITAGGGDDFDAAEGGGGSVASQSAPETAASDGGGRSADATEDSALAVPPNPGPSPTTPGRDRKVERVASLTLSAPPQRIRSVGDRVVRTTQAAGGYVASSTITSTDEGGGGTYELKVPVRRLDRTIAELSRLAHVAELSQSTQDITGTFNSARARLREARAERQSLLRQLADAVTVNETESVRARLRVVRSQIAAAKDAVAQVNRRAAYATVAVTLTADADAPVGNEEDDGTWTPGDALRDAGRILEVAAGVALVALAVALPLGLLALLAWLVARRVAQRRREQALDAAA